MLFKAGRLAANTRKCPQAANFHVVSNAPNFGVGPRREWTEVPLRIQNTIGDIVLEGDAGAGAYYEPCMQHKLQPHGPLAHVFAVSEEQVIQAGSYVDIDLSP